MENKINIFISILLAGIFIMLAYLVFTQRNINVEMSTNNKEDKTIAVSGKAETFVKPDTASVSFSLTKKSSDTSIATQSVNQRAQMLINQLKKIGVAEKDIKTTSYNITPEYSYEHDKRNFDGYRVTQRFKIAIRDLDKVSQVLATVNSAGVDNVSQLSFYVDKEEIIKKDLRKKAIEDAKKNAKQLAKDLGVSLDKIVGFKIGQEPIRYWDNIEAASPVSVEQKQEISQPVTPTGENKFELSVSIIYKIQN